jgi:MinD-like ATPase involved in chromosome partitioning or flagellar assembly
VSEVAGRTPVLCAVRGPAEAAVATALTSDLTTAVTRRCADVAELLAAAAAGLGVVAVVSGDLPGLERDVVAALHDAGVRVVALVDAAIPWEDERVRALGVDTVVVAGPTFHDASALAGAVHDALRAADPAPLAVTDRAPDDPYLAPGAQPVRHGAVVAVWGPTGAPGRTTLAINLAAELAEVAPVRHGRVRDVVGQLTGRPVRHPETGPAAREVLLADADTYGGAVAQLLGLLDESAGIAGAARAAGQGVLDAVALARQSPVVAPGLRVLTGIVRPARWPELPSASLDLVWERAREVADVTIVDCGFCLERDELLSYDTRAPQRNGATLSALAAADAVVVVGGADPVGIQRLVRGLADLDDVGVLAPRIVAVNRVRASTAGAKPESAVRDVLARYAGVTEVRALPDDPGAVDRAVLEGRALAECAPGSSLRGAIVALAREVVGLARPAARAAVRPPELQRAH